MSSDLQNGYGSFTVSYDLDGQTYTTSVNNVLLNKLDLTGLSNLDIIETINSSNKFTYYSIILRFSDNNFPIIHNNNNRSFDVFGIIIGINLSSDFNNYNYILATEEYPAPSIIFTKKSALVSNITNINVNISYIYKNIYYNFKTLSKQDSLEELLDSSNYNGIYTYIYLLNTNSNSISNSPSNSVSEKTYNTATFMANGYDYTINAVELIPETAPDTDKDLNNSSLNSTIFSQPAIKAGSQTATVTRSLLKLLDPSKTSFTDDEAADIGNSAGLAVSHVVSAAEQINKALQKTRDTVLLMADPKHTNSGIESYAKK